MTDKGKKAEKPAKSGEVGRDRSTSFGYVSPELLRKSSDLSGNAYLVQASSEYFDLDTKMAGLRESELYGMSTENLSEPPRRRLDVTVLDPAEMAAVDGGIANDQEPRFPRRANVSALDLYRETDAVASQDDSPLIRHESSDRVGSNADSPLPNRARAFSGKSIMSNELTPRKSEVIISGTGLYTQMYSVDDLIWSNSIFVRQHKDATFEAKTIRQEVSSKAQQRKVVAEVLQICGKRDPKPSDGERLLFLMGRLKAGENEAFLRLAPWVICSMTYHNLIESKRSQAMSSSTEADFEDYNDLKPVEFLIRTSPTPLHLYPLISIALTSTLAAKRSPANDGKKRKAINLLKFFEREYPEVVQASIHSIVNPLWALLSDCISESTQDYEFGLKESPLAEESQDQIEQYLADVAKRAEPSEWLSMVMKNINVESWHFRGLVRGLSIIKRLFILPDIGATMLSVHNNSSSDWDLSNPNLPIIGEVTARSGHSSQSLLPDLTIDPANYNGQGLHKLFADEAQAMMLVRLLGTIVQLRKLPIIHHLVVEIISLGFYFEENLPATLAAEIFSLTLDMLRSQITVKSDGVTTNKERNTAQMEAQDLTISAIIQLASHQERQLQNAGGAMLAQLPVRDSLYIYTKIVDTVSLRNLFVGNTYKDFLIKCFIAGHKTLKPDLQTLKGILVQVQRHETKVFYEPLMQSMVSDIDMNIFEGIFALKVYRSSIGFTHAMPPALLTAALTKKGNHRAILHWLIELSYITTKSKLGDGTIRHLIRIVSMLMQLLEKVLAEHSEDLSSMLNFEPVGGVERKESGSAEASSQARPVILSRIFLSLVFDFMARVTMLKFRSRQRLALRVPPTLLQKILHLVSLELPIALRGNHFPSLEDMELNELYRVYSVMTSYAALFLLPRASALSAHGESQRTSLLEQCKKYGEKRQKMMQSNFPRSLLESATTLLALNSIGMNQEDLLQLPDLCSLMLSYDNEKVRNSAALLMFTAGEASPMHLQKVFVQHLYESDHYRRKLQVIRLARLWSRRNDYGYVLSEDEKLRTNSFFKKAPPFYPFNQPSPADTISETLLVVQGAQRGVKAFQSSSVHAAASKMAPTLEQVAASKQTTENASNDKVSAIVKNSGIANTTVTMPKAKFSHGHGHFSLGTGTLSGICNILHAYPLLHILSNVEDLRNDKFLYPRPFQTATLAVIDLLDDNEIDVLSLSSSFLLESLGEDYQLFFRPFIERMSNKQQDRNIESDMLARLDRMMVHMPLRVAANSATQMFNHICGLIGHLAGTGGDLGLIAGHMSVAARLIDSVGSISYGRMLKERVDIWMLPFGLTKQQLSGFFANVTVRARSPSPSMLPEESRNTPDDQEGADTMEFEHLPGNLYISFPLQMACVDELGKDHSRLWDQYLILQTKQLAFMQSLCLRVPKDAPTLIRRFYESLDVAKIVLVLSGTGRGTNRYDVLLKRRWIELLNNCFLILPQDFVFQNEIRVTLQVFQKMLTNAHLTGGADLTVLMGMLKFVVIISVRFAITVRESCMSVIGETLTIMKWTQWHNPQAKQAIDYVWYLLYTSHGHRFLLPAFGCWKKYAELIRTNARKARVSDASAENLISGVLTPTTSLSARDSNAWTASEGDTSGSFIMESGRAELEVRSEMVIEEVLISLLLALTKKPEVVTEIEDAYIDVCEQSFMIGVPVELEFKLVRRQGRTMHADVTESLEEIWRLMVITMLYDVTSPRSSEIATVLTSLCHRLIPALDVSVVRSTIKHSLTSLHSRMKAISKSRAASKPAVLPSGSGVDEETIPVELYFTATVCNAIFITTSQAIATHRSSIDLDAEDVKNVLRLIRRLLQTPAASAINWDSIVAILHCLTHMHLDDVQNNLTQVSKILVTTTRMVRKDPRPLYLSKMVRVLDVLVNSGLQGEAYHNHIMAFCTAALEGAQKFYCPPSLREALYRLITRMTRTGFSGSLQLLDMIDVNDHMTLVYVVLPVCITITLEEADLTTYSKLMNLCLKAYRNHSLRTLAGIGVRMLIAMGHPKYAQNWNLIGRTIVDTWEDSDGNGDDLANFISMITFAIRYRTPLFTVLEPVIDEMTGNLQFTTLPLDDQNKVKPFSHRIAAVQAASRGGSMDMNEVIRLTCNEYFEYCERNNVGLTSVAL
eukprot:Clim_evm36s108 gene=Clim_evmTU36s108